MMVVGQAGNDPARVPFWRRRAGSARHLRLALLAPVFAVAVVLTYPLIAIVVAASTSWKWLDADEIT